MCQYTCIFRKNRALAPHERSAVPLGTDHCPVASGIGDPMKQNLQYTPDNKRTKHTKSNKNVCNYSILCLFCIIYIELLFGNVGLNGSLNVKKYYGKLIATDLVRFRTELALYNSIYIYGHLVMISFSVALTSNIDGSIQYHIITLPDLLSGKIEWNNLCGSFLNSRLCPFVFSDNLNRITLIVQGQNGIVSAGDELRVWGIGFLNN